MPLNQPPFRADHVGSLLRPPALTQARADQAAGRITTEQLRAVEDHATVEHGPAHAHASSKLRPRLAPNPTWHEE